MFTKSLTVGQEMLILAGVFAAVCVFVYFQGRYLRKLPRKTVAATVVAKDRKPGGHRLNPGRSRRGWPCDVEFLTLEGQRLTLDSYEKEVLSLEPGMKGVLVYQGTKLLSFKTVEV